MDPISLNHLSNRGIGLLQKQLLSHRGLLRYWILLRVWLNRYQMDEAVERRNQWCGLNQSSINWGLCYSPFLWSHVFINEKRISTGLSVASWKLIKEYLLDAGLRFVSNLYWLKPQYSKDLILPLRCSYAIWRSHITILRNLCHLFQIDCRTLATVTFSSPHKGISNSINQDL